MKIKIKYIINNIYFLFSHGYLHPLKYILGEYIPTYLYNDLKIILKKYWDENNYWAINTS